MKNITLPLTEKLIENLHVGDEVLLTGKIYTARDQAHARLQKAIKSGKGLPLDLKGQIIYYCGPTNTPKGKVIGSCGPTTSSRMDAFTEDLLKIGLIGMIGKGIRSQQVLKAIKRYKAIYFLTYAGCGALLSKYVKTKKIAAYPDLGPEAIYRLEVIDFPLIVGIDSKGNDIFKQKGF